MPRRPKRMSDFTERMSSSGPPQSSARSYPSGAVPPFSSAAASRTRTVTRRTASGSKSTLVTQVKSPSYRSSSRSRPVVLPSAARARPMRAEVSSSCSAAVSASLPQTPAWAVHPEQFAVCSHWKQNMLVSSLIMKSPLMFTGALLTPCCRDYINAPRRCMLFSQRIDGFRGSFSIPW